MLYVDSDLLFRRSIEDIFHLSDALVVSGDLAHYVSREHSFNSGLMLIGPAYLSATCYEQLLGDLRPEVLSGHRVLLADQLVLNHHFAGRARIVGGEYNYLLACHEELTASAGITVTQARVIHFNYGRKPWLPKEAMTASTTSPVDAVATGLWLNSFADCLKEIGLRAAFDNTRSV